MKLVFCLRLVSVLLVFIPPVFADQTASTLSGPYMGQKPPGIIAEPFAPGVISTDGWEVEGVFAPGMKEFYYVKKDQNSNRPVTIGYRQVNNDWVKFTELKRKGETSFSADGNKLFMAKGFREKIENEWSEIKSLGPMIDRKGFGIMRLSSSSNETYVFDDYRTGLIRTSNLTNGKRSEPTELSKDINSGKWTAHPFIAPDESYLIWDSERDEGFGSTDIYNI